MSEIPTPNEKLDAFVNSLLSETNLSPAAIADKFSLFHRLSSPPSYQSIIRASFDFVGDVQLDNLPDIMRGFHFIYNDRIQITLKERDRPGSVAHTLLHELFEIIIAKLNEKRTLPYKLTPYKANLFAASVLMPKEVFFNFALRSDLDFKVIHDNDKYGYLSFISVLLRLRYLFYLNKVYYLGVLVENKKAYYRPEDSNNFNNFEITSIPRSSEDPVTFNNKTLPELLNKCLSRIIAQMAEEKDQYKKYEKSVTLEEGIFLLKASPYPFMYYKYSAIKTIVMQIVSKKDYEDILRKAVKKP